MSLQVQKQSCIVSNTIVPQPILDLYYHIEKKFVKQNSWKNLLEKDLWFELCFCILSSNVSFEQAKSATVHLNNKHFLEPYWIMENLNSLDTIASELSKPICLPKKKNGMLRKYRFPNVRAKNIVVASGGFQANVSWLKEYWGEAADNFIIRGTPYDKGRMLRVLLDKGAKPVGDPRQCHAVAIDARAPKFDGGIVTRLDCLPFSIVVNKHARRFYDEGEDFWPQRYAIWGRLVAQQPDQIAYSIIDSKSLELFMPSVFPPIQSDSIAGLGKGLGIDPNTFEETVTEYNKSIKPGTFDFSIMDDCETVGLDPPKSHWARPLDTPPYYGYPLRPGITFTYLGVTVNERAQVVMQDDKPSPNIFAAGEIMAGNILGKGYMAGFGMTIGTVFGRIAGKEAARNVIE